MCVTKQSYISSMSWEWPAQEKLHWPRCHNTLSFYPHGQGTGVDGAKNCNSPLFRLGFEPSKTESACMRPRPVSVTSGKKSVCRASQRFAVTWPFPKHVKHILFSGSHRSVPTKKAAPLRVSGSHSAIGTRPEPRELHASHGVAV